ncbi:hypothetical protein BDQ17DRAFT_1427433 [Cyathus striatus]|nr:hypothetical protein BDQ17DRAFT_1427433 [Cyathus striatus]
MYLERQPTSTLEDATAYTSDLQQDSIEAHANPMMDSGNAIVEEHRRNIFTYVVNTSPKTYTAAMITCPGPLYKFGPSKLFPRIPRTTPPSSPSIGEFKILHLLR